MNFIKKYKFIFLSLAIGFLSVYSLTNSGLPPTHDGEYHILRFEQFHKSLSEGTLYPRWAKDFNNGYGIPLFNYVYPLPNYVSSLAHFAGMSFIDSFKLNMIIATITGAIFFYLWTKKYWGEVGGLVSSTFYSFSPYHLLDVYVRGSVGEVWSLGLAPALLWAYLSFNESRKKTFFILSAVFLALLILAHNILALIFFTFFLVYACFLILSNSSNKFKFRAVSELVMIILIALGLSAPFWLPALFETSYVRGLQVFDPTAHFPKLYALIYSSWGYGFSGKNVTDQMSFQIGIANLLALSVSIVSLFFIKNKRIILFFLIFLVFTIFLIIPFSSFLWKNLPLISYVQFPWRFLSLVILITSFLAGSLPSTLMPRSSERGFNDRHKSKYPNAPTVKSWVLGLPSKDLFKSKNKRAGIGILLILLSIGFSMRYAKAPFYHQRNDEHYLSRPNFTDGTNSPGNAFNTKWFNADLKKTKDRLSSDKSEIQILSNKSSKIEAIIKNGDGGKVLANIAYFPGWEVSANNKNIPIEITKDGLFEFSLPKGESLIEVELKNTTLRLVSLILSVISIFILFGLFVKDKYIKIN